MKRHDKLLYLLAALIILAAGIASERLEAACAPAVQAATLATEAQAATLAPADTAAPLDENALIEAALLSQGYFRDDVPLTYELQDFLHTACEKNTVPYALALGLIEVESSFQPDAISPAGCYGLCQLNPEYFPENLTPAENIAAGIGFLGDLIAGHGTEDALTLYNSWHTGPSDYSRRVLAAAERWRNAIQKTGGKTDGEA